MNMPRRSSNPATPVHAAPAAERLPYEPPCLEWLGNLRSMTMLQQSIPVSP